MNKYFIRTNSNLVVTKIPIFKAVLERNIFKQFVFIYTLDSKLAFIKFPLNIL